MRKTTFAVLGACILLACHEKEKTGSTSISLAAVRRSDAVDTGDAERMIAVARCSRITACAKIRGRDVRIDRNRCEKNVGDHFDRELSSPSCRDAISRNALEECLGEVGAEDCDRVADDVTLAACRPNALCGSR